MEYTSPILYSSGKGRVANGFEEFLWNRSSSQDVPEWVWMVKLTPTGSAMAPFISNRPGRTGKPEISPIGFTETGELVIKL